MCGVVGCVDLSAGERIVVSDLGEIMLWLCMLKQDLVLCVSWQDLCRLEYLLTMPRIVDLPVRQSFMDVMVGNDHCVAVCKKDLLEKISFVVHLYYDRSGDTAFWGEMTQYLHKR